MRRGRDGGNDGENKVGKEENTVGILDPVGKEEGGQAGD